MCKFFKITSTILLVLILIAGLILDNRWYFYIGIILEIILIFILSKKFGDNILKHILLLIVSLALGMTFLNYGRENLAVSFTGDLIGKGLKTGYQFYYDSNGETYADNIMENPEKNYDFNSWQPPKGYSNEEIKLEKSRAYYLKKDEGNHEKVVYMLHGGAYVQNFVTMYNEVSVLYSQNNDDSDVFSLDYRTAPEDLYPAALEDAVEGYKYLVSKGYKEENIVVAGDSAGGGLAIALAFYLRDNNIKMPKALVLASP